MHNQTGGLNVFTVGGTVQAGPGIYIPRKADDELLSLCREGVFAYMLTARQMGKSSLMVRTAERLSDKGIKSVTIDLTKIGAGQEVTAEKWYLGLLVVMTKRLGLKVNVIQWWQERTHLSMAQRLTDFFEDILLVEVPEQVVIFIDEIDTTLRLSFTDDFYAAIRYMYNERSRIPAFRRLSFVLIGVATPSDLIHNPDQTPFNIGQRVELTDFTFDESLLLAVGFHLSPEATHQVLGWVRGWTNGHPYLTQRLCRAIADQDRNEWVEEDVSQVVASTFLGERSEQDNNLQFVADMLTERAGELGQVEPAEVLLTYGEIRRGQQPVRDEEQSLVKSHLKLSGVVCRDKGLLKVRNKIYREVFDDEWVKTHLPPTWVKRQLKRTRGLAAALAAGLVIVTSLTIIASNRALEARKQSQLAESRLVEAVKLRQIAEWNSEESRRNSEEAVRQRERAETALKEVEEQKRQVEEQRSRAVDAQMKAEMAAKRELKARKQAESNTQEAIRQRNLADLHAQMDRFYRDGVDLYFKGKQEEAISSFNKALTIYRSPQIGDVKGQAVTLSNIAAAYGQMNDNAHAVEYYREANSAYSRSNDQAGEASTSLSLGNTQLKLFKYDDARKHFISARDIYSKNGDLSGQAESVLGIASTYYALDRTAALDNSNDGKVSDTSIRETNMPEAIKHLERAAELYGQDGEPKKVADTLRNIGQIYGRMTRPKEAIDYFIKASAIYIELKDLQGRLLVDRDLRTVYEGVSDKQEHITYLTEQISRYRDAGDKDHQGQTLYQLAKVYESLDDMDKTLENYEQAVESQLQAKQSPDVSSVNSDFISYSDVDNITKAFEKVDDKERAVKFFGKLTQLYQSDSFMMVITLRELAKAQRRAGKRAEAIKTLQELIDKAVNSDYSSNKANAMEELAELYSESGDKRRAAEVYEKAIDFIKRENDKERAALYIPSLRRALGRVYKEIGEVDKSVNNFTQLMSESNEVSVVLVDMAEDISDIYRKAGDKLKADNVLNEVLQKGLSKSKKDDEKIGMLLKVGLYYKKVEDYPKATSCFDNALKIYNQSVSKDRRVNAWIYELISDSYLSQGDKQKTIESINRAIEAHKAYNNHYGVFRMQIALAFVQASWGDEQKATTQLYEALTFYRSVGSRKELPLSIILESLKLSAEDKSSN